MVQDQTLDKLFPSKSIEVRQWIDSTRAVPRCSVAGPEGCSRGTNKVRSKILRILLWWPVISLRAGWCGGGGGWHIFPHNLLGKLFALVTRYQRDWWILIKPIIQTGAVVVWIVADASKLMRNGNIGAMRKICRK